MEPGMAGVHAGPAAWPATREGRLAWYYLAEVADLEVWLVNARDVKHVSGRGKSAQLTELRGRIAVQQADQGPGKDKAR